VAAKKSHTSSSPRRKERRAQLWTAQQKRKEERRLAGAAAAKKNRELRSQGLPTPTDKWAEVKERAAEARQRRSSARKQSQFHQRMGGISKLDRRTPKLRQAWRAMAAGRPDVFA
jgi:hypothetical protein